MSEREATQAAERPAASGRIRVALDRIERLPKLAVAAAILTLLLAEQYSRLYYRNQVDDAMTSIQYAKQLALGNGLVFNVGERVEGYTNFLWVVFMAPIYAVCRLLGIEFVPLIIHVNILISACVVVLVYALAQRAFGPRHLATFVAVLLCVADNSFTVWAALGLEVHFLALLMLLALWFAGGTSPRRAVYTGLALLGVHLTRPDAGLFSAVVVGNELFEAVFAFWKKQRPAGARRLRDAATMAALWVLPYAAYFAWRYAYYGAIFPNTYYLKLEGEIDAWARGLEYLRSFLDVRAFIPLFGLLALFSLGDPSIRTLFIYLACHVFYVTYVGGDFFPGHRFYVPEIPQFALLVGAGVASLARFANRAAMLRRLQALKVTPARLGIFGFALAGLALGLVAWRGYRMGPLEGEILRWRSNLSDHKRVSQWVRKHKPPNATFATCLIGHTGYYAEAHVIDVCGVLDPVVAKKHVANFGRGQAGHEKIAPADYIFAKKPDFVGMHIFHTDLWRRGYFLDPDIPRTEFEGLWTRDTLTERGSLIESTRITFERGALSGWVAEGDAFQDWPSRGSRPGQGRVLGAWGGFVNSYHASLGTRALGKLRSAPLDLVGDLFVFRMAGGNDVKRLTVSLLVNEKVVFRTTGRRGDMMSRRAWDIRPYRGRQAVLEIVDAVRERWGYLAVDEIAQWSPQGPH